MDFVTHLKHLNPDYELGFGFFLFSIFEEFSKILCLFLLFALGLMSLYTASFSRDLIHLLRDLILKLKNKLCSEKTLARKCDLLRFWNYIVEQSAEKSKYYPDSDNNEISALRKLIKIEQDRANAAYAELEKEREASTTAAREAMAMITRLQNEKSSIEMESNQHRRLAEEKQIHDQEVIQTLKWIVFMHESDRSLLQEEVKLCRRKLNKAFQEW